MGHRLDITATENAASTVLIATAAEHLVPPSKPQRWRPWAWAAAALLHVLVLALFLISFRHRPPDESQQSQGVSVVFDSGTPQTTAPPAPVEGPVSPAHTPPPAALPPPAQQAQTLPEVNLDLPDMPLAPLPQPAPQPQAQPQPVQRRVVNHTTQQKYTVMNDMSFGSPAPPMPYAHKGLNLSLPESDAEAANAPEVTVHGDVGADWDAELDQWVNDHKYYPDSALEQGQQGSVKIHFTVDRKGNVTGLRLVDSSGSPFLDQAWLGMFQQNQLPPFPAGTKANTVTIDATLHYEIIR